MSNQSATCACASGRSVRSPIITSGSSRRRVGPARWWLSTPARRDRSRPSSNAADSPGRHFTHSPPSRSHRRGPRAARAGQRTRHRPGRSAHRGSNPHRARRRALRIAGLGTWLRYFARSWTYLKPYCVLGSRSAVLRGYAVQRGLRSDVRRYTGANECLPESTARAAAGHDDLLWARIHRRQPAICARPWNPRTAPRSSTRESVAHLRDPDAPSLPSRMSLERQVNPFLRCDEPTVRAAASARRTALEAAAEVFGVLRAWKDQFR